MNYCIFCHNFNSTSHPIPLQGTEAYEGLMLMVCSNATCSKQNWYFCSICWKKMSSTPCKKNTERLSYIKPTLKETTITISQQMLITMNFISVIRLPMKHPTICYILLSIPLFIHHPLRNRYTTLLYYVCRSLAKV